MGSEAWRSFSHPRWAAWALLAPLWSQSQPSASGSSPWGCRPTHGARNPGGSPAGQSARNPRMGGLVCPQGAAAGGVTPMGRGPEGNGPEIPGGSGAGTGCRALGVGSRVTDRFERVLWHSSLASVTTLAGLAGRWVSKGEEGGAAGLGSCRRAGQPRAAVLALGSGPHAGGCSGTQGSPAPGGPTDTGRSEAPEDTGPRVGLSSDGLQHECVAKCKRA